MEKQLTELFPTVSRSTWMDQVKTDLKGQAISGLAETIEEGWVINPFVHGDQLESEEINTLTFDRKAHQLPIQAISDNSIPGANKEALFHLQNGAGGILLENIDNEDVLRDIDVELAPVLSQKPIPNTTFVSPHQFHLTYGGELRDDIANWLAQLTEDPTLSCIMVRLSDNFYQNIGAIRAIRAAFNQLKADLNLPSTLCIVARYDVHPDQDLAYNLQTSTPKVLAALLAGADHILAPDQIDSNESKWYHNLVHLITLETGLELEVDTVSGSFYLEKVTNSLADRVWETLKTLLKTK